MLDIIKGAGLLIYPLALCSLIAVYIIAERFYALRKDAITPDELVDAIVEGRATQLGKNSVLARIVEFAERHKGDPEAVKAFARLEVNRMERGVPYLDVIYVVAPMLGLTGTVFGLLRVFSGLPDPVAFTKGVSLALSATLIGLGVAILSVVPAGYLQRKVENYAVKIDLLLERILARVSKP